MKLWTMPDYVALASINIIFMNHQKLVNFVNIFPQKICTIW